MFLRNIVKFLSELYEAPFPDDTVLHQNLVLGSKIYIYIYRCPRRNVPDFGRVFLMLKYTDITKNTYVQS